MPVLTLLFGLGDVGELGAVFSCPALGEHPSQLFYKPYESWTSLQTWSASLPAGESATVLAIGGMGNSPDAAAFDDPTVGLAGSGTILVATSRRFVRFFSGAGLQKYLWHVGEEIVTMAAAQDWALIVHRASGGGAALEYTLIDTDTFEVVQAGKVPLQQGATLSWVGFTSDSVRILRSVGLLKLTAFPSRRFLPCTTRKACCRFLTDLDDLVKPGGFRSSTRSPFRGERGSRSLTGPSACRRTRHMWSSSR